MTQTAPAHEYAELQRRFKRGFTIKRVASGHFRIIDPNGKTVRRRDSNVAYALPATPGRSISKAVFGELDDLGVLKPLEEERVRKELTPAQLEARARSRAALETRRVNRQQVADTLRERLGAITEPLGGFAMPGMQADLAYIGALLSRELTGEPLNVDRTQGSMSRVMNGHWVDQRFQNLWNGICARLEQAGDIHDEWFTLVRRARGIPDETVEVSKPVEGEWPFRVELLSLEALIVDHEYQRPVPWPFVRKLAAGYDESLVGTIDVAERRRGAIFAVLDGQLRSEATRMVGKTSIWCSIYSGLDRASEARFFLHKNRDRKAVHPFYTFRARVTANDPIAKEIDRIVTEHGYKIAIGAPRELSPTDANISAIAALELAYKMPGGDREALSPTLAILRGSTHGRRGGQSGVLIRGVARVVSAYDNDLDTDRLREVLSQHGPELLLGRARDERPIGGYGAEQAMATVLVEAYNRGLRTGRLNLKELRS